MLTACRPGAVPICYKTRVYRAFFRIGLATLISAAAGCGDDGGSGASGGTDAGTDTAVDSGSTSGDSTSDTPSTGGGSDSGGGTTSDTTAGSGGGTDGGATGSGTDGESTGDTGGEPAVPWKVPDSLTQLCANLDTFEATECPEATGNHPGQDGDYSINPPTYEESSPDGDALVTDTATGLVWQAEISDEVDHAGAVSHCEGLATDGFGGRTDWRLPTRRELAGIWDIKSWMGGNDLFPMPFGVGLPQNSVYWTSTPVAGGTDRHWAGSGNWAMLSPTDDDDTEFDGHFARCVSGDATPPDVYATTDGGETVTHENTGLVWTAVPTSNLDWGAALNHCEGLDLAGHDDWRLPTFKELYSVLDEQRDEGSGLLPDGFDSAGTLWSSTPLSNTETYVIQARDGSGSGVPAEVTLDAICVRGGS